METIEKLILNETLADAFSPDNFFTYSKYLLYKKWVQKPNFLTPINLCSCRKCGNCENACNSIMDQTKEVFEQITLDRHCLDCFVICESRTIGQWPGLTEQ